MVKTDVVWHRKQVILFTLILNNNSNHVYQNNSIELFVHLKITYLNEETHESNKIKQTKICDLLTKRSIITDK